MRNKFNFCLITQKFYKCHYKNLTFRLQCCPNYDHSVYGEHSKHLTPRFLMLFTIILVFQINFMLSKIREIKGKHGKLFSVRYADLVATL